MEILNITNLKSLITFTHLAGLALGLGGAWMLDVFIFKHFQKERLTQDKYQVIEFVSRLVLYGLVLLWVSGLMFIAYYYWFTPEYLQNQKVWAKSFIVLVLTINGMLVHQQLLPLLKQSIGQSLVNCLDNRQMHQMLSVGVISFVSWLFPVVLGVAKTLNFSAPALAIAGVYILTVVVLLIAANMALPLVNRRLVRA